MELRRSLGPGRVVDGFVAIVFAGVGPTSASSGIVLRSLLVPVECGSSSSTAKRRPRQRRALGGSGLIFGGRRIGVSATRSAAERPSLRLGVMTPGFSCCVATAWTLRDDADAGSSMPRRSAALIFRPVTDDPPESIESIRVEDGVSGDSGFVLVREIG